MKGKYIVIIAICMVGIIIGVVLHQNRNGEAPYIPPINGGEQEEEEEEITACSNYRDIPLGESFEIQPSIILEKAVAPAHFEFGSLVGGAWIDSWEKDGMISLSGEDICYWAGDPIWILLYNGTGGAATFNLDCQNAPMDINHSDETGKDYAKAPDGFLSGIACPSKVSVEAHSAIKVPISIQFPTGLDYPDQWEFRIFVSDLNVPGMVGATPGIRFFCTMQSD